MKRTLLLALALAVMPGCKKDEPQGKLAKQLVGKWNDKEDGSLAWEFAGDGNCKAFGEMDCKYEVVSETGEQLKLRYNGFDKWEDVEVTFAGADEATWKNLTTAKEDPDGSITKLSRVK